MTKLIAAAAAALAIIAGGVTAASSDPCMPDTTGEYECADQPTTTTTASVPKGSLAYTR